MRTYEILDVNTDLYLEIEAETASHVIQQLKETIIVDTWKFCPDCPDQLFLIINDTSDSDFETELFLLLKIA